MCALRAAERVSAPVSSRSTRVEAGLPAVVAVFAVTVAVAAVP
jgi:hypothetical protein